MFIYVFYINEKYIKWQNKTSRSERTRKLLYVTIESEQKKQKQKQKKIYYIICNKKEAFQRIFFKLFVVLT